jgi:hypothetical protein
MIEDLSTNGLVGPSKSPYAIPAIFMPKSAGSFWLVVIIARILLKMFLFLPLPKMEKPFEHFGGAVVFKFSLLSKLIYDSNSSDDCLMYAIRPI